MMMYFLRMLLGVILAPILYNRYLYLIGLSLAILNTNWIFVTVLVSLLKTSLLVQDDLLSKICKKIIEVYKIRYSIEPISEPTEMLFENELFIVKINDYDYSYRQYESLSNIYQHDDYLLRFVVIRWCFQIFGKLPKEPALIA